MGFTVILSCTLKVKPTCDEVNLEQLFQFDHAKEFFDNIIEDITYQDITFQQPLQQPLKSGVKGRCGHFRRVQHYFMYQHEYSLQSNKVRFSV